MITESLHASKTTESTSKITMIIRAQTLHYHRNLAGTPRQSHSKNMKVHCRNYRANEKRSSAHGFYLGQGYSYVKTQKIYIKHV